MLASGKTPAGTHRPIMVQEVLEILAPKPGDFAVDATLGYGGHTAALLEAVLPGGRVLALDVDPIELPKTEARLRAMDIPPDALMIRRSNFAGLARVLAADNLPAADVVLADLGAVFDAARRSRTRVHLQAPRSSRPAHEPAAWPAGRRHASRRSTRPGWRACWKPTRTNPTPQALARAIVERQQRAPITTTTALAETVAGACVTRPGDRSSQTPTTRFAGSSRRFVSP